MSETSHPDGRQRVDAQHDNYRRTTTPYGAQQIRPFYDGHPLEVVTRPDGSVIERDERNYATVPMTNDGSKAESTQETSRSVVVTRPNGTQVSVSSSAAIPNDPMTFAQLEFLATTEGLEIR